MKTTVLTKEILQEAADNISLDNAYKMYMCHVVWDAAEKVDPQRSGYIRRKFENILKVCDVSTEGSLYHQEKRYADLSLEERQALRFDFLNLLAEAIDDI